MIKYILKKVKDQKIKLILLAILSLISSIASVLSPYVNGIYIDFLVNSPNLHNLLMYVSLVISIGLLGIIINFIFSIYKSKLINELGFKLHSSLISHIQKIPWITTMNYDSNYLNRRLSDDTNTIINFFLGNYIGIISQGLILVILMLLLLFMNYIIFLTCLLFIPVYLLAYYFLRKPLFKKSLNLKEETSVFYYRLTENLKYIKELKSSAAFNESIDSMTAIYRKYFIQFLSFIKLSSVFSSIDSLISLVFQTFIVLLGGYLIINNRLSIGMYVTLNTYYIMITGCIKYYFQFGKDYQQAKASYARLIEFENINEELNGNKTLDNIKEINCINVNFSYRETNKIISNFNYKFNVGNIYILEGANGSGKTTFLNMIIGLLASDSSGKILYNGISINDYSMQDLRKSKISICYQKHGYPDTIVKELIEKYCVVAELEEFINKIGLYNFIYNNDFNLSEILNKNINTLSDGQRQKITILLAIMKNAQILILDEPTSNLDKSSIMHLIDYLKKAKKNRIIIVTTHNPLMECIADFIINLEKL